MGYTFFAGEKDEVYVIKYFQALKRIPKMLQYL